MEKEYNLIDIYLEDKDGNLKVTTNTPTNYPAVVIQTSTGTIAFQLFPGNYADTYTPQADRSGFPKIGDYFISDSTLSAGTARFNSGQSGLSGNTNFAYGQVVGIDQDNNLVFVNFASDK